MFKPQRGPVVNRLPGPYSLAGFSALGFLAAFGSAAASALAGFAALASGFLSSPFAALSAWALAKSSALVGPFGASSFTGRVTFTEPPAFSTRAIADLEAPATSMLIFALISPLPSRRTP